MFAAIKPIYHQLGKIFKQRFSCDTFKKECPDEMNPFEDEGEQLFEHFDVGLRTLNTQNITLDRVPYAALEWGETTDVNPYRMPEGYKYNLVVPLVLITRFGTMPRDGQFNLIFRPEDANGNFTDSNLQPGIGELVLAVGGFFWQQYHTGRFSNVRFVHPPRGVDAMEKKVDLSFFLPEGENFRYEHQLGSGEPWESVDLTTIENRVGFDIVSGSSHPSASTLIDRLSALLPGETIKISIRAVDAEDNRSVPVSILLSGDDTAFGPPPESILWDYKIIDFTQQIYNPLLARVDTPLLEHLREIAKKGLYRAVELDLIFEIEERKLTL